MSPSAIIPPTTSNIPNAALPAALDGSVIKYNLTPVEIQASVPARDDPIRLQQSCNTAHMLIVKWTEIIGWETPEIQPYGNLSLSPSASVLHYATEAFEGMKAYRGFDGKLRIFRPDLNCARFLISAGRVGLPPFPPSEVLKLIEALLAVDGKRWLSEPGTFFYLRPTIIGSGSALGISKPREATMFIFGALFPQFDGGSGLKLLASNGETIRAWPGGFGYAKIGANYGPSMPAQAKAKELGFDQILWLFGENNEVTEAGASNFFLLWQKKDGSGLELITAPLGDKMILDGITRRSVIDLGRERLVKGAKELPQQLAPIEITERKYTMAEVLDAAKEERIVKAFVAGTAVCPQVRNSDDEKFVKTGQFFIAPVKMVEYCGHYIKCPMVMFQDEEKTSPSGEYTKCIKKWLKDIMYGNTIHKNWGYVIEEKKEIDQLF